jgi:aspartyl/asparaginyl-tRNA synthetase
LEKLKDMEGLEDAGGSQRLKDLKKQVETLKEEVFKAETGNYYLNMWGFLCTKICIFYIICEAL